MSFAPFNNPLCIALDVDSREEAVLLARQLSDVAGGFKLGPRLIQRYGETIVQEIAGLAPVFVDCKYFDIPSTMEAAVRASFEAGASVVTVHALAGQEALQKMAELETELNKKRPFRILAVTILTSWSEQSLPSVMNKKPIADHVLALAQLVKESGLKSVVCSAEEIDSLKGLGLFLLTPGIRLATDGKDDQKRTMSPQEALSKGSSALVVGRPIIAAKDPAAAALQFLPKR